LSRLPSNFDSLSPLEKRAAVERATGLTWEQYAALPIEQRNALLNSLKGNTFESATLAGLGAARKDSFWSGVGGYFSGMGAGLKLALVLGLVATAYVMLPKLAKAPRRARRAA
jgi:hypothetical protein